MNCPTCNLEMNWCSNIPMCLECAWVRQARRTLKAYKVSLGEPAIPVYIVTIVKVTRIEVRIEAISKAKAKSNWQNGQLLSSNEIECDVIDVKEAA